MSAPTKPPVTRTVFIGQSDVIEALHDELDCAARSDAKILITGETGVGKEVAARLIHERSARATRPLVTLNCAGLPDSLLESELFGHVRGSFTGAYKDKPGLLEMSTHGTMFLDEVGEMSTRMQSVLLRFLESGEIQRIGADRPHTRVDTRLIAATNRNIESQITAGAFREDLYFRLNVIRVTIPPLRDRVADIPLLVDYFLTICSEQHRLPAAKISPEAIDRLVAYRWPGNIRELRNVIERMALKSTKQVLTHDDLPQEVLATTSSARADSTVSEASQSAEAQSEAEKLAIRMLEGGESFWSAVYPIFISRDLTRNDLRRIVQIGLEKTNGNYRLLVQHFNMPPDDYKRFLAFLRKYDCHLPFRGFRAVPPRPHIRSPIRIVVASKR